MVSAHGLRSCNLYSKGRMYADDTSLIVAHSDEYILEQQMNHNLQEIQTWLIANKLSLM